MNLQYQPIKSKVFSLLLVTAVIFAAGCSTDSGAKKSAAASPTQEGEYLSAADARSDPDRIICRRHKPTGSRISEKICMTASQWRQMTDDTQRALDKAQRTTGGDTGN